MQFSQNEEPDIKKPIIIAAMQDMGNVGNDTLALLNDFVFNDLLMKLITMLPTFPISCIAAMMIGFLISGSSF